jgi:Ca2+-binding RTX toxin-like protein
MFANAHGGNDTLTAGLGFENYLYGDGANVADTAVGGDDRLVSGTGKDEMWGDGGGTGGADAFAFLARNGADTVHDFQQGLDVIEFSGALNNTFRGSAKAWSKLPETAQKLFLQPVDSFDDLRISDSGGNSIIDLGGGNSVTVVAVTGLTVTDFDFV